MVSSRAIISPYERLAHQLFSGGTIGRNELRFANGMGFAGTPNPSAREAAAVFEAATVQLVADTAVWVVPSIPGISLAGHPARAHFELGRDIAEDVCAVEFGVFVLKRDGRRPDKFQVNSVDREPSKEFLRSAALISTRRWHHPGFPEGNRGDFHKGLSALARGDDSPLLDLVMASPPSNEFDELSDSLFGAIWDVTEAICAKEAPIVAPGLFDRPSVESRALRVRLAILQQAWLGFFAPLIFDPRRLLLLIGEWGRLEQSKQYLEVADSARNIVATHELWVLEFSVLLSSALLSEGTIGRSHMKAVRRAIVGEHVWLPGRRILARQLIRLGFGAAALRLEMTTGEAENLVLLRRRLWGARLLGQLSVSEAASVVGISRNRARRIFDKHPIRPVLDEVLAALSARLALPPGTAEVWAERWIRGEIPLNCFDDIEPLASIKTDS